MASEPNTHRFDCPCGTSGKVRRVGKDLVVYWKRDGVFWPDYEALTPQVIAAGVRCGYCGVPAKTLVYEGIATPVKEKP